jgi:VWFA-related protein
MRLLALAALAVMVVGAAGQNAPSSPAGPDEPVTFRTGVQLVTVPVVVRDKSGHAVGGLEEQDFQLFDNGKRQEISRFSVEQSGDVSVPAVSPAKPRREPVRAAAPRNADVIPDRFVAYLFDDIHMEAGDVLRIRSAAAKHLASALGPGDRGAIYTTSGVGVVEFTSDRDELQTAVQRLMPRPMADKNTLECPQISFYQADLIVNRRHPIAINTAVTELQDCEKLPISGEDAVKKVTYLANLVLTAGERATRVALGSMQDAVARMEVLAGQRQLMLVSPGFLIADSREEVSRIIRTAIKARVTVSALDVRGLWTDPNFDASVGHINSNPEVAQAKSSFVSAEASIASNVIAEISSGTGGRFFENSNDLETGLRQIAAAPEYVYMLAFSPRELKNDGKFHSVKVTLKNGKGLTIDARNGYYAPMHFADRVEQAKYDVREAVFSRDEVTELPVDVVAQFFKPDSQSGQIIVHTRIFPQNLKFRREDDRNKNQVRVLSSVFDTNGRFIRGIEKLVELQMRDQTLEQTRANGIVLRTDFDVEPGKYLVRVVVRDLEGEALTTQNVVVGEAQPKKK